MEINTIDTELTCSGISLSRESVKTLMNNHRMRVALMGYRIFCDAYYEKTIPQWLSRVGLSES